jgi:hypothetical protein
MMRRGVGWLLALASLVELAAAQPLTIASSVVVRTAPRADAPEVAALLGGVRAEAAAVEGVPGWVRLTAADGRELGFAWQQDLEPAATRRSLLAGALGGGAAPPAAVTPEPARTSLLVGALTGGVSAPNTPDPPPSADASDASSSPASERSGALSGFLQGGGGGPGGQMGLSALTDGRLAQAQAAHAEEQRRLADIAEAQRRAAEAERLARAAEDEARRQMEAIERRQQRAEERRREQEGNAIIANAVMGAALSIGSAMADNLRASNARMLAESQQRMADANRRAAELRMNAARADAERARKEAAAAAASAQQPRAAQNQQQTARVDYLARAQAQRAAEANFQQRQAALQQAQRTAALAVQNQAALQNTAPGGGSTGASSLRSQSNDSASAAAPMPSSTSIAAAPSAASVVGLDINYHDVGRGSGTRQVGQIQVSLTIRDVNVNGDKSRICADFRNPLAGEWKGGYRLTDRYTDQTFARLTVGPGQTTTVCEILPAVKTYYVVLRQDGPPRSRDSSIGVRG